jgi:predicted aspartyl protease
MPLVEASQLRRKTSGWCSAATLIVTLAWTWGAITPAIAQQEVPPATPGDTDMPLYAASTRTDRIGRILAPVEVNGQGPFRFVVDTGANRTAISAKLAATIGLVPDPRDNVEVHGVTGSAVVPAVTGIQITAGDILLAGQDLPVLPDAVFADADGILGVEGLQAARLDVDFANDKVTIRPSSGRRAPRDYLVVPARLYKGGLLLVNGRVGSVPARIIIDTGAQRTIGNRALEDALVRAIRQLDRSGATVTGATPGAVEATAFETPTIAIGQARLRDVAVTFADLHVFDLWGLEAEPALVVGMDVLGTVERFVVDYGRREFQFKTRATSGVSVRDCNASGCGTRLPSRP